VRGVGQSIRVCLADVSALAFSESETETAMMQPDRVAHLLAPFVGGVSLGETQLAQLATYLDLLVRWNARMNLTAVRAPEEIVTRHFGESLFAARHLYPERGTEESRVLDLGSGAGFPGLPIKIWAPTLHATLLESNQRKATFLREVLRALQLSEVEVLAIRAEEYVSEISRENSSISHCTVTLRAVERFQQIVPAAVNLLRQFPGSARRLALLIGAAQVETAHSLATTLTWSDPLDLPGSSQRVLLVGHCHG
jgi:16S rRNA (guanine527-N7)-methyltransferase